MEPKVRIFLSYAREDRVAVEALYNKLTEAGFSPWRDVADILPGEKWAGSIEKAIREADFILACLSTNSVDKRGWVQRELKAALDVMQGMLDTDIYLIPVRMEECDIPDSLRDFQVVNLYESDGWRRLVAALNEGLKRQPKGIETVAPAPDQGFDMKAVDMVFLQEGGLNCVLYWRNGEAYDFRLNRWEQMALSLTRQKLSNYSFPLEAFICLRGDHLIDGADRALITHLLDTTAKLVWGASRYVVKDQGIGVNALGDNFASLSFWFDAVLRGGATDVTEIQMENRYSLEPLKLKLLRDASDESRSRHSIGYPKQPGKIWKCHLLGADDTLFRFLKPFIAHLPNQASGNNLVITMKAYSKFQEKLLKDALQQSASSLQRVVSWLDSNHLPPKSLEILCDTNNLKLLHCRGVFELRYLLHILNAT